jgi:hypothetical protein
VGLRARETDVDLLVDGFAVEVLQLAQHHHGRLEALEAAIEEKKIRLARAGRSSVSGKAPGRPSLKIGEFVGFRVTRGRRRSWVGISSLPQRRSTTSATVVRWSYGVHQLGRPPLRPRTSGSTEPL